MLKKELIRRATEVLRLSDARKKVSFPKHYFYISDDEGHRKKFPVRRSEKGVLYNEKDVEAALNACLYVVGEALKRGEEILISGFGKLYLRYWKPRPIKSLYDGSVSEAGGGYYPRFDFGDDLARCAKFYEQSLDNRSQEEDSEDTYPDDVTDEEAEDGI